MVSVLESKGWKKVKVLDDSESRKPFTKEIADAEAYRVKRAMGGNAVSRKEAGSWVIYHLSPPKKTGVAALNEIKKATKNSGWTVTHMGKNGNSSTTIKNEYKKPRKQTGVSVNFANLYPPKFKGQYKFVKYEFDNHGQITFDVNDRLSGLFYRDIPGNQGHTKAGLVKYIKSQIDMNPNWIRIGTSTRKKGAKKTSEEPIEGKRWEVTQNKPTAGKKAAPKQSGLIKTASVKKTAPKKAKPVKKMAVKKVTAPKKVTVKKTAAKKVKQVKLTKPQVDLLTKLLREEKEKVFGKKTPAKKTKPSYKMATKSDIDHLFTRPKGMEVIKKAVINKAPKKEIKSRNDKSSLIMGYRDIEQDNIDFADKRNQSESDGWGELGIDNDNYMSSMMAADVKRESPKFEVPRGPGGMMMYPPKPIHAPQGTKDPFAFLISPSAIMGPDLKAEAYKQKQEDKATRYMDLAHKKRKEAASIRESSHAMVNGIPFGQPILSGSKGRRDRKLRDRSWDMIGKSIKVGETADYYEQKAKNAANPKGISSDDPTAIAQLKRKIDGAKQTQENMKAVNKIAKSKKKGYTIEEKVNDIMGLGYSRHDAIGYMKEDYAGRVGCPSYLLTNNNANIRRMEQRIKELESQKNDVTKKMTIKGVKVVDDVQDNRLRVFFDDKPDATVRSKLKSSGFRWSPSAGAWQSYRGDKYMARLKEIL